MTQRDIELLLSHNISTSLRLDLLNSNFVKISEIQSKAISLSPNISNNSDVRRICQLKMLVLDAADMQGQTQEIWLDRIVRPYLSVDDGKGAVSYLLGSFLVSDAGYVYDAITQELTLSLVDLMGALTEARGSQVGGANVVIPYGTNAREALIATVARFSPFKRYSVVELPDGIPYDLEFNSDAYPYQILRTIMDLFPFYQMYYSVDGIFTVEQIPDGIEDPIAVTEDVMDKIIISESRSNSRKEVKNTTEIFGMELDAGYTASGCASSGNRYVLTISTAFEVLEPNSTFSFTPDKSSTAGQAIKIQDLPPYPIYVREIGGDETALVAGAMQKDVPYVVKYLDERFYLQGELDIHVIVQEVNVMPSPTVIENFKSENNCRNVRYVVNPDSKFAADRIGMIKQVLKDGDYANIYTTELAFERALYENYKRTRLQDTVEVVSKLMPALDVNQKIRYRKFDGGWKYSLYTNENMLSSTDPNVASYVRIDESDGNLIFHMSSDYATSPMKDVVFSTNSDGELIVTYEDSSTVLFTQDISHDLAACTTSIHAIQYYPLSPFVS